MNASKITKVCRAVQRGTATEGKIKNEDGTAGKKGQSLGLSRFNISSATEQQLACIRVAVGASIMKRSIVEAAMIKKV